MKGRKPLPTNLKVIRGTAQPCRLNEKEPRPVKLQKLTAPKTLSDAARKHWRSVARKLEKCGVLTVMDQDALALYCELYAQWVDANAMVQKKGMVIADARYRHKQSDPGQPVTVPVLSPYFRASLKLADQMKQLLGEFGMTPSSRTRIRSDKDAPDDEFETWQKKRQMAREGV